MPEFDLPGHIAGPLCSVEPGLCVANKCAPDPSNAKWWAWLEQVVSELADIFPERYFHGGADEFHAECWLENDALKSWAAGKNMSTAEEVINPHLIHLIFTLPSQSSPNPRLIVASQVLDYFHLRWQRVLLDQGRLPQFWDEFFWVYDAPSPTRTNLTILPGTSAL
jgi:hypothetical protein